MYSGQNWKIHTDRYTHRMEMIHLHVLSKKKEYLLGTNQQQFRKRGREKNKTKKLWSQQQLKRHAKHT